MRKKGYYINIFDAQYQKRPFGTFRISLFSIWKYFICVIIRNAIQLNPFFWNKKKRSHIVLVTPYMRSVSGFTPLYIEKMVSFNLTQLNISTLFKNHEYVYAMVTVFFTRSIYRTQYSIDVVLNLNFKLQRLRIRCVYCVYSEI